MVWHLHLTMVQHLQHRHLMVQHRHLMVQNRYLIMLQVQDFSQHRLQVRGFKRRWRERERERERERA
jgi:hypothetical protein